MSISSFHSYECNEFLSHDSLPYVYSTRDEKQTSQSIHRVCAARKDHNIFTVLNNLLNITIS